MNSMPRGCWSVCAELFFLELVRPDGTDVYVLNELIGLLSRSCGNISDPNRKYFRNNQQKRNGGDLPPFFIHQIYEYRV